MAVMVALLCSPWWRNTTGQVITQDGGFSQLYLKTTAHTTAPPRTSTAAALGTDLSLDP